VSIGWLIADSGSMEYKVGVATKRQFHDRKRDQTTNFSRP
jgi:hypothetical protein